MTPEAEGSNPFFYLMFFTRQCVCFRYKNFTLSSLDSRTWVNFFKESFLVDFNYKVLFCNLIKSFLFSSAFAINHLTFNRWQLTGLYGLFVFFRTVSGAA